jgi:hypothetical protein
MIHPRKDWGLGTSPTLLSVVRPNLIITNNNMSSWLDTSKIAGRLNSIASTVQKAAETVIQDDGTFY